MMYLDGHFYIEKAGDRVRILYKRDGTVSAALLTRGLFASAIAYVSERGVTAEAQAEALSVLETPRRSVEFHPMCSADGCTDLAMQGIVGGEGYCARHIQSK